MPLRLGVNIDHVATLRNARGGRRPDPFRAAETAAAAGADGIVAHLREDRRHIRDADMERLARVGPLPLNMECAATEEMLALVRRFRPHAVCLVPERREERTTESGLDVVGQAERLRPIVAGMAATGARVSLFVDPEPLSITTAREIGARAVELHTGAYCEAEGGARAVELERLTRAAFLCPGLGLECHAGHGLDLDTVGPVAAIKEVIELNIGHALIAEAVFVGLGASVRAMRAAMDGARPA